MLANSQARLNLALNDRTITECFLLTSSEGRAPPASYANPKTASCLPSHSRAATPPCFGHLRWPWLRSCAPPHRS